MNQKVQEFPEIQYVSQSKDWFVTFSHQDQLPAVLAQLIIESLLFQKHTLAVHANMLGLGLSLVYNTVWFSVILELNTRMLEGSSAYQEHTLVTFTRPTCTKNEVIFMRYMPLIKQVQMSVIGDSGLSSLPGLRDETGE